MVCNKCEAPSGSMKCSKCKVATYCNRECQVADWPTHKQRCKQLEMSPTKLDLRFEVGFDPSPISFEEDIPLFLCKRDCPRDISSQWISDLVDTREMETLKIYSERHNGVSKCFNCTKSATGLHTTLMVALHEDPPTLVVVAIPLCSKKRDHKCALRAQEMLDTKRMPPGMVALILMSTVVLTAWCLWWFLLHP